jgi:hypothetical protein
VASTLPCSSCNALTTSTVCTFHSWTQPDRQSTRHLPPALQTWLVINLKNNFRTEINNFSCAQSDLERCDETKNGEHSAASSILTNPSSPETSSEIKSLLLRKEELTRTHQSQDWHRMQAQVGFYIIFYVEHKNFSPQFQILTFKS